MPWSYALDDTERRCFLALLRKMHASSRRDGAAWETGTARGDATVRSE
jgi:hypothetical protein